MVMLAKTSDVILEKAGGVDAAIARAINDNNSFSFGRIQDNPTQSKPQETVETFQLNAGEEKPTVLAGPGTFHEICSDQPFIVISGNPDGKEFPAPSGCSKWKGKDPIGVLSVKGRENNTVLKIKML